MLLRIVSALLFGISLFEPAIAQQPALHWQPWSDAAFAEARQQHKFVLLDLEAVWCHWCHVMDDVTYRDPAVIKLLNAKYVLVKVDQDSRPDISNRYQDYGWPATVVFARFGFGNCEAARIFAAFADGVDAAGDHQGSFAWSEH